MLFASSSLPPVLFFLPAVIWALLAYVLGSSGAMALQMRAALGATTSTELAKGRRSWTRFHFLAFSIVLGGLLLWTRLYASSAAKTIFTTKNLGEGIFSGCVLGLALVGFVPILQRFTSGNLRFFVVGGAGVWPWVSATMLVFVALTEELWRSISLRETIESGSTAQHSLLVTSVAYALAYLALGYRVAISNGLVGAIYGALYLWSGSLSVPLAAHAILQGYHLAAAIGARQEAESEDVPSSPKEKCPACGIKLSARQLKFDTSTESYCPACGARLTLSDGRRALNKWGFIVLSMAFFGAACHIFAGAEPGTPFWLYLAVAIFATSGVLNFTNVIFPPRLECVGAYFVQPKPDQQSNCR